MMLMKQISGISEARTSQQPVSIILYKPDMTFTRDKDHIQDGKRTGTAIFDQTKPLYLTNEDDATLSWYSSLQLLPSYIYDPCGNHTKQR